MTRTSEQTELDRARYNRLNPDPRFNTGVSKLQQKLRQLKILDDPHATAFVVDDLIWTRFVFRKKNPVMLFRLLQRVHGYWAQSVNMGGSRIEEENARQLEFTQFGITRDDEPEKVSLPPGAVIVHFESKGLRAQVRQILIEHLYAPAVNKTGNVVPACSCGKEFDFIEEWANHVRTKIWRALGAEPRVLRESSTLSPDGHSQYEEHAAQAE